MPQLSINPEEITSRLHQLTIAYLCECCELPGSNAIIDIWQLLAQVNWLYIELAKERLQAARLEAAIRAALDAYHEGEADPLAYLRDEILDDLDNDTPGGWRR